MSTYNNNQELIATLTYLCKAYTEHFPKRKIYLTKRLGRRLSYLTGSGKDLYLKPVEIPIGDRYTLFIESSDKLRDQEINILKKFFAKILIKDKPERLVDYHE